MLLFEGCDTLTEVTAWRVSPAVLEWFATPRYTCLDAKPKLVKRLQRPLQPHWIGKVGPGSTSLFLLISKASHICLASKLLYQSCNNEDAKQNMWVGRKNTERVKWANQMCRVHCSSLSCSSVHGCHVYAAEPKLVILLESSVYRCCCRSKGWRRPKILEQNDQHRLH